MRNLGTALGQARLGVLFGGAPMLAFGLSGHLLPIHENFVMTPYQIAFSTLYVAGSQFLYLRLSQTGLAEFFNFRDENPVNVFGVEVPNQFIFPEPQTETAPPVDRVIVLQNPDETFVMAVLT
jgi:hypothetical protein